MLESCGRKLKNSAPGSRICGPRGSGTLLNKFMSKKSRLIVALSGPPVDTKNLSRVSDEASGSGSAQEPKRPE